MLSWLGEAWYVKITLVPTRNWFHAHSAVKCVWTAFDRFYKGPSMLPIPLVLCFINSCSLESPPVTPCWGCIFRFFGFFLTWSSLLLFNGEWEKLPEVPSAESLNEAMISSSSKCWHRRSSSTYEDYSCKKWWRDQVAELIMVWLILSSSTFALKCVTFTLVCVWAWDGLQMCVSHTQCMRVGMSAKSEWMCWRRRLGQV